jgi:hypothetical protein
MATGFDKDTVFDRRCRDNSLYDSLARSHSTSCQRVRSKRIIEYRIRTGMAAPEMLATALSVSLSEK